MWIDIVMLNLVELFGFGNGIVIEGWFGVIWIGMIYFVEIDV